MFLAQSDLLWTSAAAAAKSLQSCLTLLAQLRHHTTIDYTQQGLRFKLQAWEVSMWGAGQQEAVWLGPGGCLWAGSRGPSRAADPALWALPLCHRGRWARVK